MRYSSVMVERARTSLMICCLLECVASCRAAPSAPPPVVVLTPAVTAAPTAAPDPSASADAAIVGRWTEHFDTRSGCTDQIEIERRGTTLVASGSNCNNGEPYNFESVKFDGSELRI